jgi:hypothetical protein
VHVVIDADGVGIVGKRGVAEADGDGGASVGGGKLRGEPRGKK